MAAAIGTVCVYLGAATLAWCFIRIVEVIDR